MGASVGGYTVLRNMSTITSGEAIFGGTGGTGGTDGTDGTDGSWIFWVDVGMAGWSSPCRGEAPQEYPACENAQTLHRGNTVQGEVCPQCARNLQLRARGLLPRLDTDS